MEKKTIEYRHGNLELEGYLAHGGSVKEKRPGILICHEWKGLTPYEKSRADQLASAGFVAFAADIYGKGVRPHTVEGAAAEMNKYREDRALLQNRVKAGLEILKKTEGVDPARIAVIGYCFGGCAALELGRSGADVLGIVTFHALFDTPQPARAGQFKAKVLSFHGADDPMTHAEAIQTFQKEMKDADVDYTLTQFGGVVHNFTNPNIIGSYHATADSRSWAGMIQFFGEIF